MLSALLVTLATTPSAPPPSAPPPMIYDLAEYEWIVVFGALAAFFAAFGIGANDVANAYATSVGSKALTIKQACFLAVIFEFIGATFLSTGVTKTIRKGIAKVDCYEEDPAILMYGMFSVILAVGIWLILATKYEMPVSTTHSCVGGICGMTIVAKGMGCVVLYKAPFSGFLGVVMSWFFSPILSGLVAMTLFFLIRTFVLRNKNSFTRAVKVYPILVTLCVTTIAWYMLKKGIKVDKLKMVDADADEAIKFAIALGIGLVCAILMIPVYKIMQNRIETGKFVPPVMQIENVKDAKKTETMEAGGKTGDEKPEDAPKSGVDKVLKALGEGLNHDVHLAVGVDERTTAVHENAEKFDPKTEGFFVYLQIASAIFDSIAHGSNDVANAVGPFATIYIVFTTGEVGSKSEMDDNKYWIMALGGVGIGAGLLLYGYQIMRAIGVKLAVITPSRGFSIEMGSSLIVIIGSFLGIPLSTTHCQVGATTGVALLEGHRGCNKWVLFKTAIGWVVTCFIVGLMSAGIFAFGAYAPSHGMTYTARAD
jgi:sodium-dependent phosphate transporter